MRPAWISLCLLACAPDLSEPCATSDQPSLDLTVKGATGDSICDAEVIAYDNVDPTFSEALVVSATDCSYSGVTERPGGYKVTISAHGYQTKTIWPVAGTDDCGHVSTKRLIVLLSPDLPVVVP